MLVCYYEVLSLHAHAHCWVRLPKAGMTSTLARAVTEYSIILGGRVGVGKTSLYHRILYDSFPEEPRTPSREDGLQRGVYSMLVHGENVKVRRTIVT